MNSVRVCFVLACTEEILIRKFRIHDRVKFKGEQNLIEHDLRISIPSTDLQNYQMP